MSYASTVLKDEFR